MSTVETLTLPDRPVPAHRLRPRAVSRFLHDRSAVVGLAVVLVLATAAVLAPLLAAHDPNTQQVADRLAGPSQNHPLGTDELGRDVFSRLLFGARVSIGTTALAAAGIALVGLTLGSLAGFFGGVVDTVVGRTIDVLLAFPTFLLALGVTGTVGPGLRNLTVAVVAVWWAGYARVVRAAVLQEREQPYVEAARSIGATQRRVLVRHVLPNVIGPVVVLTTLDLGAIMLGLSAFSFLGLGVQQPTAEWGAMLAGAKTYLGSTPLLMIWPGLAIFAAALAFNLVGDGLRDAFDPRAQQ